MAAATGAGANAASGLLSPAQLRNAAINQNRRAFARGTNAFTDLANAGVQAMIVYCLASYGPDWGDQAVCLMVNGTLVMSISSGEEEYAHFMEVGKSLATALSVQPSVDAELVEWFEKQFKLDHILGARIATMNDEGKTREEIADWLEWRGL